MAAAVPSSAASAAAAAQDELSKITKKLVCFGGHAGGGQPLKAVCRVTEYVVCAVSEAGEGEPTSSPRYMFLQEEAARALLARPVLGMTEAAGKPEPWVVPWHPQASLHHFAQS